MDKEEQVWMLVGSGSALIAGVAARRLLTSAWRRRRGEPPRNPDAPDVGWGDALLWAALSGLIMGLARVAGRKAASGAWRRWRGYTPTS